MIYKVLGKIEIVNKQAQSFICPFNYIHISELCLIIIYIDLVFLSMKLHVYLICFLYTK